MTSKTLVDDFFKKDNILDRIRLLKEKITSKRKTENLTAHSYYLNISSEDRFLYMVTLE